MKRLLLLDADVIIDLHSLDLFEKIIKAYDVYVPRTVFREARYFKKEGRKEKIGIAGKVTVVDVAPEDLNLVRIEAKEARRGIDAGEMEAIAYLNTAEEDLTFCTCDKAAITLVSYMGLEERSASVEKILKSSGHHKKNLFPRHLDKMFKACVKEGKTLRIQFKI
ncbi:MAG: hypothetical protein JRE40_11415 [Deltaproteobacteria bacterium]|nr:hypothetical protein [Deltaproteobacteria bacterium]MBW2675012.1 hypothetical protein [Deltaproteobacteria bacterium]